MLNKYKQVKIGSITTSEIEIKDLIKAWVAISIAFGIVIFYSPAIETGIYTSFIISGLTVGIGFLLHELGHKLVAQKYGCFAEFRAFDTFLILAIAIAIFTRGSFVFAAPGAVIISGPVGIRRNGKISVAGPLVNLVLALLFLSILLLPPAGIMETIAIYGFLINSWLALFNMIPLGNLDGAKVLRWNKPIYALVVIISLGFMFLQNFFPLK